MCRSDSCGCCEPVSAAYEGLKPSPRELWFVFGPIRFALATTYYTLAAILMGFLERGFDLGDKDAAMIYGVWGGTITLFTLLGGWVVDRIGVRRSLACGTVATFIGFQTLAFAKTIDSAFIIALFILIPIGAAFGLPVCDIAQRRYSSPQNEHLIYPLGHSSSSFGQALGLMILSIISAVYLQRSINAGETAAQRENDTSAERMAFVVCACMTGLGGVMAAFLMRDLHVNDHGRIVDDDVREPLTLGNCRASLAEAIRDGLQSFRNKTFQRASLFVVLTLPVRHIFLLLFTSLAVFIRRSLGVDMPVYAFMLIDPLLEGVLAPLFALFMRNIDIMKMMIAGSFIISCGTLGLFAFQTTILSLIMSISLIAIGAAILLPRIPQYILVLSPEGKEGRFSAFSNALPIMIGKILVGLVLGVLLDSTCPPAPPSGDCGNLWRPSAYVSFISPFSLALAYRFIHTVEIRHRFQDRLTLLAENI